VVHGYSQDEYLRAKTNPIHDMDDDDDPHAATLQFPPPKMK
jgi:hypothetical protein